MAFIVINPEARICRNCGERRCLFRNSNGPCCFRCPSCELSDILACLRGEVGMQTSAQFLRNMGTTGWQVWCKRMREDYLAQVRAEDCVFLRQCGIAAMEVQAAGNVHTRPHDAKRRVPKIDKVCDLGLTEREPSH
jgi:hypothetical protein